MTDHYPPSRKEFTTASTLVVGLGDLGSRIATEALGLGGGVLGMRRQNQAIAGIEVLQHDATAPWPEVSAEVADVVLCLSPQGRGKAGYEAVYTQVATQGLAALKRWAPQAHVWLISSTSVYAQCDGEWVDEASPAVPDKPTAAVIRAAERIWLSSSQPATVLRLAGIYGPGRPYLLRQAEAGFRVVDDRPVYTNRIHVDDAARAVVHLIAQRRRNAVVAPPVINLADQVPVSLQDLMPWLQQQLHVTPDHDRRLARGSKRISSKLLAETGFQWRYPSYREGYVDLITRQNAADGPSFKTAPQG